MRSARSVRAAVSRDRLQCRCVHAAEVDSGDDPAPHVPPQALDIEHPDLRLGDLLDAWRSHSDIVEGGAVHRAEQIPCDAHVKGSGQRELREAVDARPHALGLVDWVVVECHDERPVGLKLHDLDLGIGVWHLHERREGPRSAEVEGRGAEERPCGGSQEHHQLVVRDHPLERGHDGRVQNGPAEERHAHVLHPASGRPRLPLVR
mmetsp:Transcript_30760/g.73250  ORF Transcript_30760/g.73250 Transcript_30760/m.73250 type:complete len:205 (-) Transcript_30760:1550-2164(-)